MKTTFYALFVLLLVAACQTKENKNETVLAATDFDSKLKSTPDAIVLDVRRVEELSSGVIEGAINIVYDPAFETKLAGLPKKPIFIYCASGIRSGKAAKILREKGYDPVYELEGGLSTWIEQGMPLQTFQP